MQKDNLASFILTIYEKFIFSFNLFCARKKKSRSLKYTVVRWMRETNSGMRKWEDAVLNVTEVYKNKRKNV